MMQICKSNDVVWSFWLYWIFLDRHSPLPARWHRLTSLTDYTSHRSYSREDFSRDWQESNQPERSLTNFFIFLEKFKNLFKEDHSETKYVAVVGKDGVELLQFMFKYLESSLDWQNSTEDARLR